MQILLKGLTILLCLLVGLSTAHAENPNNQPSTADNTKPRMILLHGLFGQGNTIAGSPYFPELPGWIQGLTGRYPLIPNLGAGNFESQYQIAINAMNASCSSCRWHVVGHSRGGLVARMVMERNPTKVASITQVASPNRGCSVCDLAKDHPDMLRLLQTFGATEASQVVEMSQQSMNNFNQQFRVGVPNGVQYCLNQKTPSRYFHSKIYPSGNKIHAASLVGNRFGSALDEFTTKSVNVADPTYYGNQILGTVGSSDPKYSASNDGVVAACSAGFGNTGEEGMVLSAVDHNDAVYQLLGMSSTRSLDRLKAHIQWLWQNVN